MVDSSVVFSITQTKAFMAESEQPSVSAYDADLRAHLERHIAHGDFFHLLATYFGFLEETAADPDAVSPELRSMQVTLARSVRANLQHLSKGYHVQPRTT